MTEQEVRITSETGGEKGKKRAQLGAVDPQSLMALARVAGFGAEKYARYNMLNGYDWSLSYDALQRHLHAFWSGEDRDAESGELHLAHAAWHCLTLTSFLERNLGTDDRYKAPTGVERLRRVNDEIAQQKAQARLAATLAEPPPDTAVEIKQPFSEPVRVGLPLTPWIGTPRRGTFTDTDFTADLTERAGTPAPGVYGPHQGVDWQKPCGVKTDHTPHRHGVAFWCIG